MSAFVYTAQTNCGASQVVAFEDSNVCAGMTMVQTYDTLYTRSVAASSDRLSITLKCCDWTGRVGLPA